MELRLVPKLRI